MKCCSCGLSITFEWSVHYTCYCYYTLKMYVSSKYLPNYAIHNLQETPDASKIVLIHFYSELYNQHLTVHIT